MDKILNLDGLEYDLSELYSLDDSYFYDSKEKSQKISRIKNNLVTDYNYYNNDYISFDEIKRIIDKHLYDQLIDSFVYTMNRLNGRNYYDECRKILYAIINTIMNNNCDLSYSFFDDDLTEGFGKHVYFEMVRLFRGSNEIFKKIFNCNVWENIYGVDGKANLNNCSSEEEADVRKYMCMRLLSFDDESNISVDLPSRINLVDFVFDYHMNSLRSLNKTKCRKK